MDDRTYSFTDEQILVACDWLEEQGIIPTSGQVAMTNLTARQDDTTVITRLPCYSFDGKNGFYFLDLDYLVALKGFLGGDFGFMRVIPKVNMVRQEPDCVENTN